MDKEQIQHLYNRAGFGILPSDLRKLSKHSRNQVVKWLLKTSQKSRKLVVPTTEIDAYLRETGGKMNKKDFKALLKKSRSKHLELNKAWLNRMATTESVLRERMTLFWMNHFVVRSNNFLYSQDFHNTLRTHALGNFKSFVIAISKEPAMLDYLNNQQNQKAKPNENFARELMELFTLGEGNYSEMDIKEAARAFTGWRHNRLGEFKFTAKRHDFGKKTFLGKTGNFNGEDIIELILEQDECAEFIARKVYIHFVHDIIDETHIAEMSSVFRNNYDIAELMEFVFTSDWFYNTAYVGSKIKSPIDFLVGMKKIVPFSMEKARQLKYVEKLLGQVLFEPPNVAGWPEGRAWIDANTMMVRLKLPSVLLQDGAISFDVKGEFEDSFEAFSENKNFSRKLLVTKKWNVFKKNFEEISYDELAFYLMGLRVSASSMAFLNAMEKVSKQELCVQIMSLPEYQLC